MLLLINTKLKIERTANILNGAVVFINIKLKISEMCWPIKV